MRIDLFLKRNDKDALKSSVPMRRVKARKVFAFLGPGRK